jgi:hypothetical protein
MSGVEITTNRRQADAIIIKTNVKQLYGSTLHWPQHFEGDGGLPLAVTVGSEDIGSYVVVKIRKMVHILSLTSGAEIRVKPLDAYSAMNRHQ